LSILCENATYYAASSKFILLPEFVTEVQAFYWPCWSVQVPSSHCISKDIENDVEHLAHPESSSPQNSVHPSYLSP
jgi:hypothetical protein